MDRNVKYSSLSAKNVAHDVFICNSKTSQKAGRNQGRCQLKMLGSSLNKVAKEKQQLNI